MANFFSFLSQEWILVSLLAVLGLVYYLRESRLSGQSISSAQLTKLVNQDEAVVVDIRPSAEYKAGHLVNAINIPQEKINSELAQLEKYKSKTIIVVDKIGQYSGTAGKQLTKEGFNVKRLSGGITEWQQQNLPLVKTK